MKKLLLALLLLFIAQWSTAQKETVAAMRSQVAEMTKQIHKKESFTYTIFKENMVPIELLRKAAEAPELFMSKQDSTVIKSIGRERYHEILKTDHEELIATAKKYQINWSKIQFVELLYKNRALFKLGQPGYEGLWIFKDTSKKDVLFTIQVDFIMLGTQPYILEMDDLKLELK